MEVIIAICWISIHFSISWYAVYHIFFILATTLSAKARSERISPHNWSHMKYVKSCCRLWSCASPRRTVNYHQMTMTYAIQPCYSVIGSLKIRFQVEPIFELFDWRYLFYTLHDIHSMGTFQNFHRPILVPLSIMIIVRYRNNTHIHTITVMVRNYAAATISIIGFPRLSIHWLRILHPNNRIPLQCRNRKY